MDRFNIPLVAEGLTTYAIERQNGFERDLRPGEPPWAEQRRFWTDAILQGMARLEGLTPDPVLMERFDQELDEARHRYFIIPARLDRQRDTIRALNHFVVALENTGQDRRRQVQVVQKMMDDMACHSHWGGADNGLDQARDNAERAMLRMTAHLPICFTRILLGGDAGPYWESGFVSGPVTEADEVKQTAVYERARRLHPEITEWPALCTVCTGHGLNFPAGAVPANEFDLEIINSVGDHFLKERDVQAVASIDMLIPVSEQIRVLKVEPGAVPEVVTLPNTLEAFQAGVGGYIETLGLDYGVFLICNEEGKLIDLPANRQVGSDTIAGTFFVTGETDGEFCSLPDTEIAHYMEQFAQPLPSYGPPDRPTPWELHVF